MAQLQDHAVQYGLSLLLALGLLGLRARWPWRKQRRTLQASVQTVHVHAAFLPPSLEPSTPAWLKAALESDGPFRPFTPLQGHLRGTPSNMEFGAAAQALFAHDPHVIYLNHGSYGSALRVALEVRTGYQVELEEQPVLFMETVAVRGLLHAARCVAAFVGALPRDLVAVRNATEAVCCVLQSLPWQRGKVILLFNTTYPAVRHAVMHVAAQRRLRVLQVELSLEQLANPQSIVAATQVALAGLPQGSLQLAILDHIISFPPVHMPIAQLCAVCKQAGACVLVDGAHAVGAVPLDIPALGCDWYTSNLHKWACAPKGAAFLWAAPAHQAALHPLVTSHGAGLGFVGEFLWQGTHDPSSWLAVPAALQLLQALGLQRVWEYNSRLVHQAAHMLSTRWPEHGQGPILGGPGPSHDSAQQEEQPQCSMLAVGLPAALRGFSPASPVAAGLLHAYLREQHRIEVPVVFLKGSSRLWVRLSAQIYNQLKDYEALAAVIDDLCMT